MLPPLRTVIFIAVALDREARIVSSLRDHVDPVRSCFDLRNNAIAELSECDEYLPLEPGLATIDKVLLLGLIGHHRFVEVSQKRQPQILLREVCQLHRPNEYILSRARDAATLNR